MNIEDEVENETVEDVEEDEKDSRIAVGLCLELDPDDPVIGHQTSYEEHIKEGDQTKGGFH